MIEKMILICMTLTFRRRDGGQYPRFDDFYGFYPIMDKLHFILFLNLYFLIFLLNFSYRFMLKLHDNDCSLWHSFSYKTMSLVD